MDATNAPNSATAGDDENVPPSNSSRDGVVRSNSVRARANMFQQLQNRVATATTREERTSPKKVIQLTSPSTQETDEPKTPNNPEPSADDEIEPSSLPLSERLRFFSRISEGLSLTRSISSRLARQNNFDRSISSNCSTPQSSNNSVSSPSITPTPFEGSASSYYESCVEELDTTTSSPATAQCSPYSPAANCDETDMPDVIVKPSVLLKLARSASQQAVMSDTSTLLEQSVALTTNSSLPSLKRIKLKTVGKLLLPQTFLCQDRNNNNCKNIDQNALIEPCPEGTPDQDSLTHGETKSRTPIKKIGKIKSPFIEMLQQQQYATKISKLTNGENLHPEGPNGSLGVEMRQKHASPALVRNSMPTTLLTSNANNILPQPQRNSCNIVEQFITAPQKPGTGQTTPTQLPRKTPGIVDKYGKFFGLSVRESLSNVSPTDFGQNSQALVNAAVNRYVRQPVAATEVNGTPPKRRDLMKRSHGISSVANMPKTPRFNLSEEPSPGEHRAQEFNDSGIMAKKMRNYDKIMVSKSDLLEAEKSFSRLWDKLGVTEQDLRSAEVEFATL